MEKQKRKNGVRKSLQKLFLPPPALLTAVIGNLNGEIDLDWKPVRGATTYIIQSSSRIIKNPSWKYVDVVTKSRHTVTNLKHGKTYWFRVAAVGSKGQGTWSQPVNKKVI